jgi:hypothetical protein
MAPAFTKFDPRSFLESEEPRVHHAKAANPAKGAQGRDPALATLATLAARSSQNEKREVGQSSSTTDHGENCNYGFAPAKVAKVESSVAADDAMWGEAEEERAAIAEYDGAAPRIWAEALARLDPNKPPGDVPPRRWLRFIDDCGRFLDGGWAARAAALGWGPLDLFGCDRERPFARVDHLGLLWLLNGGTLPRHSRGEASRRGRGHSAGGRAIPDRPPYAVHRC